MRIGDVSRARRFANPARLRWYAFHRSVRFALRMMKSCGEAAPTPDQLSYLDFSLAVEQDLNLLDDMALR
jgi:hypothetical protein